MAKRYYFRNSTIAVFTDDKTVTYTAETNRVYTTRLHSDGTFMYIDGSINNIHNLTEVKWIR